MIIKNGRTNWGYVIFVIILAAVFGGGILYLQNRWEPKNPSVMLPIVVKKPVPRPTEINPNFLTQINECFIPTAAVYGYNLRITSGFRSMNEQSALYSLGRTSDGHIVSWSEPGKSLHNYGFAVDVVDRWRGYYINWARLGKIGSYCGLEQVDNPHFEHRNGLTTDQFAAGMKPSLLELPCALMDERAKTNQALTLQDLESCGAPNF